MRSGFPAPQCEGLGNRGTDQSCLVPDCLDALVSSWAILEDRSRSHDGTYVMSRRGRCQLIVCCRIDNFCGVSAGVTLESRRTLRPASLAGRKRRSAGLAALMWLVAAPADVIWLARLLTRD